MNEIYDDDETRLMIADDISDSSNSVNNSFASNGNDIVNITYDDASPKISRNRSNDLKLQIKISQNSFIESKKTANHVGFFQGTNIDHKSVGDGVESCSSTSLMAEKTQWHSMNDEANCECSVDDERAHFGDSNQEQYPSNDSKGYQSHVLRNTFAIKRSSGLRNSVARIKGVKSLSVSSIAGVTKSNSEPASIEFSNGISQVKRVKLKEDEESSRHGSGETYLPATPVMSGCKKIKLIASEECIISSASSSNSSQDSLPKLCITRVNGMRARKRKHVCKRHKSTCVHTKPVQLIDDGADIQVGARYCLDFYVSSIAGNTLYFVTNWNGQELCGVIDGGAAHICSSFKQRKKSTGIGTNSGGDETNVSSHENNNSVSSKQRTQKRPNRSSSTCLVNGEGKHVVKKISTTCLSDAPTGELPNDEEPSQSSVFWLSAGCSEPLLDEGLSHSTLCEVDTSNYNYFCPVGGCGHRFDCRAALTFHYSSHFDKITREAIIVETAATQTDRILPPVCREIGTDPIPELAASSSAICDDPSSFQVRLTPVLSNMEQQSIKELFKVVEKKDDARDVESALSGDVVVGDRDQKGFIEVLKSSDVSRVPKIASVLPTSALEAMQKMLLDDQAIKKENSADENLGNSVSASVLPSRCLLSSQSLSKSITRTIAASPAFSDISDDAPTLEKEVSDKIEDCSLNSMTVLMNSGIKSPLEPLSLSVEDEKVGNDHIRLSASLKTPLPCSTVCSINASSDSPNILDARIGKKNDGKEFLSSVNVFPPSVPYAGIDPSLHFSPVGLPVNFTSSSAATSIPSQCSLPFFYNPSYLMNYAINPSVPQVSNLIPPTSASPSKHRIHDLKGNNIMTSSSRDSSCAIRLSPSIITSPGSRSHSVGPLNTINPGTTCALTKNYPQLQSSGSSGSSKSVMKGAVPFGFPPPVPSLSVLKERDAAAYQAHFLANQLQRQQMQMQLQYNFPVGNVPTSMNPMGSLTAQQAYEQLGAFHAASFGAFAPPNYPPK